MSIRINVGATFDARDLRRAQRELDALKRSADTLQGRMTRLGTAMQSVGSRMQSVGRTLTRTVTAPLAAIGVASVKTAADFESSFAKIQGLVGVSADELGALEEAAARLGPQFGRSSTEAAEALFFITSAGLRGADAIDTLEAALKASAVGLGDTATVADLVTSTVNAYGSSVISAAEATDTLTAAVRLGKLEPTDLAGSMGMVLPVASAMGVTFDEVGAAFAAMSRTGTDASTAATQLRQILATILKPTAEANTELEKYGLSAQGLRQQLRERGLLSVLQTLTSTLGMNDDAISNVFGNIRALSGVLDLMGSNAEATEQIFLEMANSTGVLDEAFGVTADTASFQFQQSLASLRETMRGIGEDLMPIVMRFVEGIEGLVQKFRDLSPEQQDFIVKAAAITALLGPLVFALGGLITVIGGVTIALGAMSTAMIIATGGLVLVGAAIAGIAFANMAGEADDATRALELEGLAAEHAAAGNYALADAYREQAAALRSRDAQAQNEVDRFSRQAAAARETRAENEAAEAAAAAMAEAMAGLGDATDGAADSLGASGPRVVALTRNMRDFFQQVNETNVGVSSARDLIAQFSREVLAAGNITEATARGAEMLARAIRQDIDAALQDGNRRLDEATQKFDAFRDAIAGGVTQGNTLADAVSSQTSALDELTRAEEAYEAAQASGDAQRIAEAGEALADARKQQGTFLEFLQTGALTAEAFAAQIDALRDAGASMEVVQQIAELGARTGGRVVTELLSGGAEAIRQANALVAAVEAASQRAGVAAAQQFFGAGVAAARALVRGIEETIPELQSVLDGIADAIARALGVRPDVNIMGGQGAFIPPSTTAVRTGGVPAFDPRVLTEAQAGAIAAVPLSAFENFTVPGLATGGLVTGPTLAMVGEAGPEMVIPLDRVGGMGGQTVVNVSVTSADPEAVVEAIRRYTRGNGPLGQVVTL